ncbi:hypothetical protein PYW08_012195 [Mythimna loreyi]|uniref:Uncharacterized protein n=1 Tax=Mythimna loreyi TaxID=667449 RepID=A0ACC2PZJ9_9NEOP|nr:hypothetical protein PYW08_012195 [Mythimna loreyi]
MSSFLCFICHSTVNSDTNEDTRDKYREVVGMNLCPDSHLCYICCHMLNKLWLFKSICLKRSLEYPVLFSEKGTINLQRNKTETVIICSEENCQPTHISQLFIDNRDHSINSYDYIKLEESHNDFDDYFRENTAKETEKPETSKNETFVNNDEEFAKGDDNFVNSDDNFVKGDDNFVKGDDNFAKDDEQFVNNDETFVNEEAHHSDDEHNIFDYESNKEGDTESKIGDGEECDMNYEYYEEQRNECLDEIRNERGNEETTGEEDTTNKKKSKKTEKNDFEKFILSTEEQKAELEAQRRSKKYLEAEFKCYNCALGFLFKDTYQAHMMRHEESNGEYLCMLCSLRFATGAVLRSHASLHSVRYRCCRCNEYIRARQTQTHAKYCHNKMSAATCHLCGRVFQDASGLQQHLKRFHMTKTSSRTYSCSVCGKSYRNQAAVRTHMIKHIHRKFSCDQCTSIFSSPYTLAQHKKKHTDTSTTQHKEHYCASCGVGYSSRKSLLAHQRQAASHQQRAYECPVCSRSCPNERALTSHISTVHSSTKEFHCDTCNAQYTSRKSLTRHVRSHTAPKPAALAVCHLCGASFKGKSKLNRHLREVCEKDKLEEELSSYYQNQQHII